MSAPASASPGRLEVTVRMYRQGLGDCFLLGFHPPDGETRWVLIDCGVVGRSDGAQIMNQVARHIAGTTGDAQHRKGHLHLLVATNARWDHVSGFVQARPVFEAMAIDEIWLSAAEDPGSERARLLAQERQEKLDDLRRVVARYPAPALSLARGLTGMLGLFGGDGNEDCDDAAGTDPGKGAAAFALLRDREKAGTPVRYLDAREAPHPLAGLPGVRVYVLGPQGQAGGDAAPGAGRDGAAQRRALDLSGSFLAAAQHALGITAEEREMFKDVLERNLPFDPSHQITFQPADLGDAKAPTTFNPDTDAPFFLEEYYKGTESWRRIDLDWLMAARELVLTLDSDTNNAGLVLAIELVESGKVLLFPGDAQVGAWRSWDALAWTFKDDGDGSGGKTERRVTADDLLRRTVLYKVAHHCGQGATPLVRGLERMERRDLVALLPVDTATAKTLGWNLPYPPLLKRLKEKTRGRVLLSDPGEPRLAARPDKLSEVEWRAFRQAVKDDDPLYVEYRLTG